MDDFKDLADQWREEDRQKAAGVNDHDDLAAQWREEDRKKTRSSEFVASRTDPDRSAKVLSLADRMGVEYTFADRNSEALERAEKQLTNQQVLANSPLTAKWYSDVRNAMQASDSVESLADIEKRLKGKTFFSELNDMRMNTGADLGRKGAAFFRGTADVIDFFDMIADRTIQKAAFPEQEYQRLPEEERLGAGLRETGDIIQSGAESWTPDDVGFEDQVVSGVAQAIVGVAGAVVSAPGAAVAFATEGVDHQASRMRENDIDPLDRPATMFAGGALTAGLEQLRVNRILDTLPPEVRNRVAQNVIGRIAQQGAEEAISEALETVGQNALAKTYDPDAKLLEGASEAAAVGGTAGAILHGLIEVALPGRQRIKTAEDEGKEAAQLAETLKATPLFDRNKKILDDFVKSATGNETVFIDGEDARVLLQEDPKFREAIEAMELSDQQLNDLQMGIDVEVPYSSILMNGAENPALIDSMKTDVGGVTLNQARRMDEDGLQSLYEVDFEEALDLYNEAENLQTGAERAEQAVRSQLMNAGRSLEEANASAAVWGAMFRTLTNKGVDDERVFSELGLRIFGPQNPSAFEAVRLPDGREFTPEEIAELHTKASRGREPLSLLGFARKVGLNPSDTFRGEIEALGITGLKRASGVDVDELAQRAADAGYLPVDENGKADANEFLELLRRDVSARAGGNFKPVYSDQDVEQLDMFNERQRAAETLGEIEAARVDAGDKVLEQARSHGYEGESVAEASEWERAVAKNLDMSQEARMQRARDMGFGIREPRRR